MGHLFNKKCLNRTVVHHMFMLITKSAHLDGTELSGMSPSTAKVALGSKASGNGVPRSQLMTMGTDIKWAIFSIVAEITTPKAFSEGGCGLTTDGDMNNLWKMRPELGLNQQPPRCIPGALPTELYGQGINANARGVCLALWGYALMKMPARRSYSKCTECAFPTQLGWGQIGFAFHWGETEERTY